MHRRHFTKTFGAMIMHVQMHVVVPLIPRVSPSGSKDGPHTARHALHQPPHTLRAHSIPCLADCLLQFSHSGRGKAMSRIQMPI